LRRQQKCAIKRERHKWRSTPAIAGPMFCFETADAVAAGQNVVCKEVEAESRSAGILAARVPLQQIGQRHSGLDS